MDLLALEANHCVFSRSADSVQVSKLVGIINNKIRLCPRTVKHSVFSEIFCHSASKQFDLMKTFHFSPFGSFQGFFWGMFPRTKKCAFIADFYFSKNVTIFFRPGCLFQVSGLACF